MTLQELRDELDLQLASIRDSAGVLKSDEVVDDGQCDAVVSSARKIAETFNKYLAATSDQLDDGLKPVDVPEELEPSPYQQDGE